MLPFHDLLGLLDALAKVHFISVQLLLLTAADGSPLCS